MSDKTPNPLAVMDEAAELLFDCPAARERIRGARAIVAEVAEAGADFMAASADVDDDGDSDSTRMNLLMTAGEIRRLRATLAKLTPEA